ncbi:MAG: O-antigen ligase family protein [Solirubrobacteraceae bacterium]
MSQAIIRRTWLLTPLVAAVAACYGALVAAQPKVALLIVVGIVYVAAVGWMAFFAPVAHLLCLLVLTTVLPYSLQHGFSTHPGLLPSDVFLLTGLLRAGLVLSRSPMDARQRWTLGLIFAFEVIVLYAAVKGYRAGRSVSTVGAEARTLMGYTVAFICMATLRGDGAKQRLATAMLVLGLLIGLLGVAQWTLHLQLSDSQDFGLRPGVSFTSGGVGQIQGGLFSFPLCVLISASVLASGSVRSRSARLWVIAALGLNLFALLVTFERTIWVATAVGLVLVIARSKGLRRMKAIIWTVVIATAAAAALSIASPATVQTAVQRFTSIGQFSTDDSLRQRAVESRHVIHAIRAAPFTGSGLAASVWFGRPWQQVPPRAYTYSHNGYLWLAWRLGVIGAALLFAVVLLAISWRGPPPGDHTLAALRAGSQISLLVLLIASLTFPPFSGFGSTCALGLLIGICAQTPSRPGVRTTTSSSAA